MIHSLITVVVSFRVAQIKAVETTLARTFGNLPAADVRAALNATGIVHFMSINFIRGYAGTDPRLLMELSVDGAASAALEKVAAAIKPQLVALFSAADVAVGDGDLGSFLARHQVAVGTGWRAEAIGLNYDGTPAMTVSRIRREAELAAWIATMLDTPAQDGPALKTLECVRNALWDDRSWKWAFVADPAPFLTGAPPAGQCRCDILRMLALPVAVLALPVAILSVVAWWWDSTFGTWLLGAIVLLVVEFAILAWTYRRFRSAEKADIPDEENPSAKAMQEIGNLENRTLQNHLFAVSTMKPGLLRRFTLRAALGIVGKFAGYCARPGFMGEVGSIHFARWVLLPGTDKLVFLSNYDGAWESYLEDFIERLHNGLTGIWSNTIGFPRSSNLFFGGAHDGDRFKRWARRQQHPSLFWYSAYSDLTSSRIRLNAAIRQGLSLATTEADAADWLACFGSSPQPPSVLETRDIPSLIFGGFSGLTHATCLILNLSGNPDDCKGWLRTIAGSIAHGDVPPNDSALVVAFSQTGLRKLGLDDSDLATFPVAFQHGMAAPWRASALGDSGSSAPEAWWWGSQARAADAVMLVYASSAAMLRNVSGSRLTQIATFNNGVVREILLTPLPPKPMPVREAFGFVDGVSNPIVRGTRRWNSAKNRNHVVEAGEIVLGYPDNRGYLPPSPVIPAEHDPADLLPAVPARADIDDGAAALAAVLAIGTGGDPAVTPPASIPSRPRPNFYPVQSSGQHDLGRNGTFLIVRQLEQDKKRFECFLDKAATSLQNDPRVASIGGVSLREWIAARMVGRWREDGTSLVRYSTPSSTAAGSGAPPRRPDNDFLFGTEDPAGLRCPFGAHIRRANPRDTFVPGSQPALAITNRHRILRVGRSYEPPYEGAKPGLLFMCLNADIERQFEFIQQTWLLAPNFNGLENEVDPTLGTDGIADRFTIPTPDGPLRLSGLAQFVTVRGGGYFFLPGRKAIQFLAQAAR